MDERKAVRLIEFIKQHNMIDAPTGHIIGAFNLFHPETELFPEEGKTTFRNSIAFERKVFDTHFSNETLSGVDIDHYYYIVLEWSDNLPSRTKTQKDKALRTAKGWLSTVSRIMREDKKKGKLVMKNNVESIKTDHINYHSI